MLGMLPAILCKFLTIDEEVQHPQDMYRVGHFILRFVTLEILVRSATSLAQIKVISFLPSIRSLVLFESTLANKVAPSSESQ